MFNYEGGIIRKTLLKKVMRYIPWIVILFMQHIEVDATLTIIWMAPNESPLTSLHVNASSSLPALALAIETVYNESILPTDTFQVVYVDSACSSKQSIGQFTTLLFNLPKNSVAAIFGPPCNQAMIPIAQLASFRGIPVFQWLGNEQSLDDKEELNTLVRSIPPLSALGDILAVFLIGFKWFRFVMISSSNPVAKAYAEALTSSFQKEANVDLGIYVVHHYSETDLDVSDEDLNTMLTSIKSEARIVVLVLPEDQLRRYMIHATQLGMSGGDYQFLFIKTVLPSEEDIENLHSNKIWKRGDGYDKEARQGFENVLLIEFGNTQNHLEDWYETGIAAAERLFSTYGTSMPTPATPDRYSMYLHDAFLLYAKVLNSSGVSDYSQLNGSTIASMTSDITFNGTSGEVIMSKKADRYPGVVVYDMTQSGNFTRVAYLEYHKTSATAPPTTKYEVLTIRWGDGSTSDSFTPPDTPVCGFYGQLCIPVSDTNVGLYIGLTAGMLALMMILLLIYRAWRREKELQNMSWKIDYNDLDFSVGRHNKSLMNVSHIGRSNYSGHSIGTDKNTDVTFGHTTLTDSFSEAIHRQGKLSSVAMAKFRRSVVIVKHIRKKKVSLDRTLLKEMKMLMDLKHNNLTTLRGLCTEPGHVCVLWEYCAKGSLMDIIEKDEIKLDTMFKLSIAIDICKGLEYIHKSELKYHGNMKSSNCVVDSRWTCKLTDFGPRYLQKDADQDPEITDEDRFKALFWTAPELLKKQMRRKRYIGTQAGDVYSFAVIAKELITGDRPYPLDGQKTAKEILESILYSSPDEPFRPPLNQDFDDVKITEQYTPIKRLIESCWQTDPQIRPSIKTVLKTLNRINPYKKSNVIENMVIMMEKYSNQLEDLVAERTSQLEEEKRKTDILLYRMLPRKVAEQLKLGHSIQAEGFESVTIYFSDIVGFTTLATESTPLQIVDFLNSLYTLFDDIIKDFDVYKVETIGDAYMIVSGLPERNGDRHVTEMASVSIALLNAVKEYSIPHMNSRQLQIRIGLHTGSVVAGVVGLTMPRYCLFGDTVNTASRMESNGQALKIHMSKSTAKMAIHTKQFNVEERGEIEIKGKGLMKTYWLLGHAMKFYDDDMSSANGYVSDTELDDESVSTRGLHDDGHYTDQGSVRASGKMKVHTFFRTAPLPAADDINKLNSDITDLLENDT